MFTFYELESGGWHKKRHDFDKWLGTRRRAKHRSAIRTLWSGNNWIDNHKTLEKIFSFFFLSWRAIETEIFIDEIIIGHKADCARKLFFISFNIKANCAWKVFMQARMTFSPIKKILTWLWTKKIRKNVFFHKYPEAFRNYTKFHEKSSSLFETIKWSQN